VNEEDLRAAFARHEAEAPDVQEMKDSIDREVRRRRRLRTRALTGGLAAAVALAIAVPVWLAQRTGVSPQQTLNVAASATGAAPQKDLNLLVLGSDKRASWPEDFMRSDTIMIVHIPADRKKIYTISINRDVMVDIPAYAASGFQGGHNKINSAFFFGSQQGAGWQGGLHLAEQTVQKLSGVSLDGGAVLDYGSVKQVVDTLGGVPVCLPKAIELRLTQSKQPGDKVLPAGCQTLSGADALLLMRTRFGLPNGSYDRDRNQQRVLVGVAEKVAQLNLLADAGKIAGLLKVQGFKVDLPGLGAAELALQLRDITAADVVPLSLANTYASDKEGGESITPDGRALLAALSSGQLAQFAAAHPDLVLAR
jgi:LCP family protein required for cell wall assembly